MKTIYLACVLPLLLAVTGAEASIQLGFGTASQIGSTLALPLMVSGLGDQAAPSLGAYDLNIRFDTSLLDFDQAVFGEQLDVWLTEWDLRAAKIKAPGLLNVFELSLDSETDLNEQQADNFTLATLYFTVRGNGNSSISIEEPILSDAAGLELTANIVNTRVTTVPIPAAGWLLLSGLAMLARRKTA